MGILQTQIHLYHVTVSRPVSIHPSHPSIFIHLRPSLISVVVYSTLSCPTRVSVTIKTLGTVACLSAGAVKKKTKKNIPPFSMATSRQPYGSCTDHNESVGDLLNYTSSVSWYVAVAALALIRLRSSRGIRLILDGDFHGVSLYIWKIITQTSAFKSFLPRVLASFAHKKHTVVLSSSTLMSCWDQ